MKSRINVPVTAYETVPGNANIRDISSNFTINLQRINGQLYLVSVVGGED